MEINKITWKWLFKITYQCCIFYNAVNLSIQTKWKMT